MDAETITLVATGGAGFLAVAGAVFQKLGFVRFGREKENGDGGCPDPECHEAVMLSIQANQTVQADVRDIKTSMFKLFDTVDGLREGVAFIRGKME